MDIKQLAASLTASLELPYGVTVRAQIPNNYLGMPDEANGYLVLRVEDVCCPETGKFRSQKEQHAVAREVAAQIRARVPARWTKIQATYFGGGYTQYRDGVACQIHPRLCVAVSA